MGKLPAFSLGHYNAKALTVLLALCPIPGMTMDYQTQIWINTVPGYSELSMCAEQPLSTIVRNMANGCGDGSRRTSYSCFCTASFFKFRWDISTAVVSNCGITSTAQATSAVRVFEDYCALGLQNANLVPTTFGELYEQTFACIMEELD